MTITKKPMKGAALCLGVSVFAMSTVMSAPVYAQSAGDEIVVTGIRQSLKDAMDYKRDSDGVVDAVTAEDIGKFPNSNLAEALQRIPGVSIDRVNGEGAQITVRGFGPSFNQVTLNGRSMPTADVPLVGSGQSGDASGAVGRAFDFSNLASEGVKSLEVYKTGRADIASGGIGATVNVVTNRPLDRSGLQASISAKAIHDTSVDRGSDITPEFAANASWTNDAETFGIGVFGGYSKRDSAAAGANSARWETVPFSDFPGTISADTVVTNAPSDPNTFVSLPRDSRYQFSEFERERINGQIVAQFEPTDRVRMTADYTFAVNEGREDKTELSNWFGQQWTDIVFSDEPVPTAVFLREDSSNQGAAMQQTLRMTKDELSSFGFNGEYDVKDNVTLRLDAHTSTAEVSPNAPMGFSEINVGIDQKYAAPGTRTFSHAVDYSGPVPIMLIETENGTDDVTTGDAASQVANGIQAITQKNDIDQIDLQADWDIDGNSNLVVGGNYRSQKNVTDKKEFQQILGNWGAENRGDVDALAPGALEVFCISCRFNTLQIGGAVPLGGTQVGQVNAVRGDAGVIFAALSPFYANGFQAGGVFGNDLPAGERTLRTTSDTLDTITEDVMSLYAQFDTEFQVADIPVTLNTGLRYEKTDVTSQTASSPTAGIIWQGNNDFASEAATTADGFGSEASYSNLLPNLDIAADIRDDMKLRASYSKTIARATYNNLFASVSAGTPSGPTALGEGNRPRGEGGNPSLLPLESDNFDISYEWYFDDASYISIGAFEKRVRNFVGQETVDSNLFGLRDVSSGALGTRSGTALQILSNLGVDQNEDNLFAATVYVDQAGGDMAAAMATFQANQGSDGNIDETEYDRLETNFELAADASDPLLVFDLTQPVNNREAKINGIEIQGQHFFGDSGFGLAGSYTFVNGDVEFNDLGDPDITQFALEGLSDTANATLLYEKGKLSGSLAYNWRDEFLTSANDGNRNPIYVEAYGQLDMSLGYDVTDYLSLSFEGVNLTEESSRTFQRSRSQLRFFRENAARYYVGARYKF